MRTRFDSRFAFTLCLDFTLPSCIGTIDAMMCSNSEGELNARKICEEATRVVSARGVFVVVSHMSPTGDEGSLFLRHCLIPALSSRSAEWKWDVGVHFAESAAESGPFVYAVKKAPRRVTRAARMPESAPDIPVRLHEY